MMSSSTELERYSYSYLSTFRNCERQFFHRYEQGLRLEGGDPPYLVAGSALHAALDTLVMTGWDEEAAFAALVEAWGDYQTPMGGDLAWLTLGHCAAVLDLYAKRKPHNLELVKLHLDDLNMSALDRINATVDDEGYLFLNETPLSVKLPFKDEHLTITAVVDMPAKSGEDRYAVVDRKCKIGWLNEWSISKNIGIGHQLRLYCAVLKELTGLPFSEGWIEGIYIGQYATDDEEKWAKRKSVPFGMFGPYVYTDEDLEETLEWAATTVIDIWDRRALGVWPQNDKGGCGSCEFKNLCDIPTSSRPAAIAAEYEAKERHSLFGGTNETED